uniref:Uncharacterized protein n=2 Tax=Alexandrium monilatum TaxID=311494 RepID=A0A7S4SFQ7_9DINO
MSSPGPDATGDRPLAQEAAARAAGAQQPGLPAAVPGGWFPPAGVGTPGARPAIPWPPGPHSPLPWYYAGPPPHVGGAFGVPSGGWRPAMAKEPPSQRDDAAGGRTPGAWYPPSAAEITKLLGTSAASPTMTSLPALAAPDAGSASPAVTPIGTGNPAAAAADGSSTAPAPVGAPVAAAAVGAAAPSVNAPFSKAAAAARAGQAAAAAAAPGPAEPAAEESGTLTPPEPEGLTKVDSGSIELGSLVGEWRDSMGHRVSVDWSKPGGRNGQLDVLLTKVRGSGPSIRLNVKQLGSDHFICGHYDLDVESSNARQIVWKDRRAAGKLSVWER